MKTFVANPTQTREFIANFKQANLSLKHYNVDIDNNEATFSTNTGKVFVVNTSDLTSSEEDKCDSLWAIMCMVDLGAIKHETLKSSEAPEKKIYSTHIDDNSPTIDANNPNDEREFKDWTNGRTVWSNDENQFVDWRDDSYDDSHSIAPEEKIYHDSSTSVDDDSHLSIDEVDDFITEINSSYTINQQETALKAAKIVFHYWALSGNSWNVPYNYNTLEDLLEFINAKTGKNAFLCFVDDSILGVRNLIVDEHSLSFTDSFTLFLETLDKHAVSCGVHPQFTPSQLSVYQQNYQHIVADCNAILELYREKEIIGGEYQFIPQNTKELHALINYIQDKSTADSIVESLKGEEYLFFQVLNTLNSINQTKPARICA